MTLPDGFHVEVFASEPAVRQPVAACFDERGRMWVVEYLQYPTPAGLKSVTVDQYLRTEYDRVPEPPPRGPRGADRIKILEDTDGDGKADKVKTFVEGLNLAASVAVGHGGVFVGQAPYLLFYPDRDHDDIPDGDPEVLLTGFGMQDAHATLNSLTWGPDGWLYGAQGSTVTANIRSTTFQQGIWRYEPRTKAFELFAEGGGNTYGLDFDRAGNAFGSSNGGFIAFHMVQGGYYWKGFAKHGPLHNPRTYGYFDSIPYQGAKQGGHVTPGGIIYKADAYPAEFRGAFIGGNLLSNTVYWHPLTPKGSTVQGRHGGTLLNAHDPWFRPIDLLTGPDGSVFVTDWYDKRASHLDPRDTWDKTNGRIYKIVYKDTKRVVPGDLSRLSSADLVALRTSGNDWFSDMARRILSERCDASIVPTLRTMLAQDRDEVIALRDLWALNASGGFDPGTGLTLLGHPVAGVRRWAIRLLGDARMMTPDIRVALIRIADHDADPAVRSQLASSCQRWSSNDALPILRAMMAHSEDAADTHIPLLLWWAIETHLRSHARDVVDTIVSPDVQRLPLVRDFLLERLARALASDANEPSFETCARLLVAAPNDDTTNRIVAGMEKGLEGRHLDALPKALEASFRQVWARRAEDLVVIKLGVRLGTPEAVAAALSRIKNAMVTVSDRVALIELLGQGESEPISSSLLALFENATEPAAVRLAALAALGGDPRADVARALLLRYASYDDAVKDRIRDLCSRRKTWTAILLDEIEAGRITAKDLRPPQVVQIVQLGDETLTERVEKAWGKVPGPNSGEKKQRIAEVRGILPEGDKGDPKRGRVVFKEQCAACHRLFNEGETIGPDLTGAERGNLDFLLTSLVDPSALIRKEYQAQTVALSDGRVLNGLVVEESEKTMTLVDSNRQKTVVAKADIEAVRPSATSLMPEGVLDKLPDDQVRDLFRYLQSNGP